MRYGSVCSGIEAASVAWHTLGWKPAWFAEIDKFPSAVLAHHYPDTPNLGDFTRIDKNDGDIDLLVGGTPCQDFSTAGKRAGFDGLRGSLTFAYADLVARLMPEWIVWENVPGVFSGDCRHGFAAFIRKLSNIGYVCGWRVLDAQYVRVDGLDRAVPQRRRRVFVVGHRGDWRRTSAVLFESDRLCGDTPPSRKAGERVAPTLSSRPAGGGGLGTDFDCDDGLVAKCHTAGGQQRMDYESDTFVIGVDIYNQSLATGGRVHTMTTGGRVHTMTTGGRVHTIRRLTPRECERLQGFPDDYTLIPYRGKMAADAPRYKALGNSMAVNVMRWIGMRINEVEKI